MILKLGPVLWRILVCLIFLAGVSLPAQADPQSQSYSTWKRVNEQLRLRYTVAAREVSRLSAATDARTLNDVLQRHLANTVTVEVAKQQCLALLQDRYRAAKSGFLVVDLVLNCDGLTDHTATLTVRMDTLFDQAPSHIHFARFAWSDQHHQEVLFTQHNRQHSLKSLISQNTDTALKTATSSGQWATIKAYMSLGFQHILEGIDHIVFLLALLLIVSSAREVLLIVTGFTIGHSITLSLTVLNVVQANSRLVESMIGLSIALVATENVMVRSGQRRGVILGASLCLLLLAVLPLALSVLGIKSLANGPPFLSVLGLALFTFCYLSLSDNPRRAIRYRPAITLLFGLVHGFGFANVLQEVGLPLERVPAALFGFNIGVELGQLLIVGAMAFAGFAASAAFRHINLDRMLASDLVSAMLCGVGCYWFIQRAYL